MVPSKDLRDKKKTAKLPKTHARRLRFAIPILGRLNLENYHEDLEASYRAKPCLNQTNKQKVFNGWGRNEVKYKDPKLLNCSGLLQSSPGSWKPNSRAIVTPL